MTKVHELGKADYTTYTSLSDLIPKQEEEQVHARLVNHGHQIQGLAPNPAARALEKV
jgi:hypothetical protein